MLKELDIVAFIKSQKYFFILAYKENPSSFIWYMICKLIISVLPPIVVLLNKKVIDSISNIHDQPYLLTLTIQLVIAVFLIQYISSLVNSFGDYIFTKISRDVNFVLKKLLYEKILKIPYEEYEDSKFFDDISLSNIAISTSGINVIQNIITIIGSIISLLGMLGILLTIHWTMPLALFISTLPGIILLFAVKTKSYNISKETALKSRELDYTSDLFLNRSIIKEIKIYNTGEYLLNKWKTLFQYIQTHNLKLAFWEFKTTTFAVFVLQASSLVVSLLLIKQISSNMLTVGDYVALLGAVTSVQGIFGMIGGSLGSIFETAIYNNSLIKVLNYELKNQIINNISSNKFEKLDINNLTFVYPQTDKKVLKNISMRIKKGENIAIVGHNGSGKTTLLNCLLGLYSATDGQIKLNNHNIEEIDKVNLYNIMSAIFQDFGRYKYTVRENLSFGDLEKFNKDSELFDNLKKVDLYHKIINFDKKLDTYLTKEMPNGSELSGGEWQKLAIARGFLKNTDLIILDEPTAALDPISELNIFEVFYKLAKNKTIITISHRLGPTRLADRIIVMDNGEIYEEGSFDELMSKKGMYYEMYLSQANWYKDK
ncbi:ABC transporter ATP-binding protein [Paenibacillus sp. KACC 21273]|uniref:ABC transporter ATP-binding protein n=1 Tax=Paenibacillus sp. KACC 21273 TaxID=3025665 RepID=UPI0023667966|nr:ABC transporter ATP-binding protein [Paenibacillus sp. KACC 21273]WDF50306.1 ABC transporter ATP-binding protein [Paenibacillus sp. KACC 21273]